MPSSSPVVGTLRSAKRAHQILVVLARLGFNDLVHELGLDKVLDGGMRIIGRSRPSSEITRQPAPIRIRKALEELGPTFIKVGQILSTRPDLIPAEYAEEFKNLQHQVKVEPWPRIKAVLEAEFPDGIDSVFEHIDPEPMAAGSMAQVHRAVIENEGPVVVKVLRPDIHKTVEGDLEILSTFADLARSYFVDLGFDPVAVTDQFARELSRELDLTIEARSTDRMRRDFADDDRITFPKVHWRASTDKVLTLEEIRGTLLAELRPADLPEERRERIVATATDAVFRQCLVLGFFHADPHPGNIFLLNEERIGFIDCGMTGHLDPTTAEQLATLVHGVVTTDLDRVVKVAIRLAAADPALAGNRQFRSDVWRFIDRFRVETLEEIQIGALLNDFFDVLRSHQIQCPADLVYLIKSLTTIEGVATSIAPEFDLLEHVRPYVERLVKQRYGLPAIKHRFEAALMGYTEMVEQLPGNLRDVFTAIHQKRLSLNVDHKGLDRLTETLDGASMNISYALLVAALIVGSAVLLLADSQAGGLGWIRLLAGAGFATAVVLAMMRVVMHHLHRRRK